MRSPLAYASSFKCPTRLYYGNLEYALSTGNQETATRAQAAGLDVQAVSVSGDHFTAVEPAIEKTIQFFEQFGSLPIS